MKKKVIIIMFIVSVFPVLAMGFDHGHSGLDALLVKHVKLFGGGVASEVDYRGLSADGEALKKYLDELSLVSQKEFYGWSKDRQLAFLINAYNAFTLELIVKNYPVKSIRKIGGFLKSPWKIEFVELFGKKMSLDDIEHGLIRAKGVYDEPRIHFAVVCASIGCPALQNKAFTAKNLEVMLETGMVRFLSDKTRNRFDPKEKKFEISKIFKWYGDDFKGKYGSVNQLLKKYADYLVEKKEDIIVAAKTNDIDYLDYDWDLNDVTSH